MSGWPDAGRRRRWTAAGAVAGLALLVLLPDAGHTRRASAAEPAGPPAPGMLTTQSFHKPPEEPTVFVSPYDDSDLNLKLKADFEFQIATRGRGRISAEQAAGFLLLFDTEVVPAEQAPWRPSLGSARVDGGSAEVNVNVWSTTKDSVLGGRQGAPAAGRNVFHINAVLRDRLSGEVVWQGDAYYDLPGPETERIARALVAPLVDKIGLSVVREPFEIE